MDDTQAILEQLHEAYAKAAKAVEDGHREGRVDLVEAGEALAADIVATLKAMQQAARAERQRWRSPSVRKAGLMLRRAEDHG